ncbi:hypothetical protein PHJA_001601900 [Phtheirospermum japonicum]|uniref:DUF4283 domain-containing protein n=1 Tax=Phtheirospermum japonicum TaxID=374723 RepID=A0A830CHF0_9LAMI|nr:hypothetical protein PHJA_001601900 [Phtheirospermum japonicum]
MGATLNLYLIEDDIIEIKEEWLDNVDEAWGLCLDGHFAAKFSAKGPYTICGVTLMLSRLPSCFEFDRYSPNTITVWIKMPGLPLDCWNKKIISKTASKVGTPIVTDILTRNRERVSYARVLVEIEAATELKLGHSTNDCSNTRASTSRRTTSNQIKVWQPVTQKFGAKLTSNVDKNTNLQGSTSTKTAQVQSSLGKTAARVPPAPRRPPPRRTAAPLAELRISQPIHLSRHARDPDPSTRAYFVSSHLCPMILIHTKILDVPLSARNILRELELKSAVKDYR